MKSYRKGDKCIKVLVVVFTLIFCATSCIYDKLVASDLPGTWLKVSLSIAIVTVTPLFLLVCLVITMMIISFATIRK